MDGWVVGRVDGGGISIRSIEGEDLAPYEAEVNRSGRELMQLGLCGRRFNYDTKHVREMQVAGVLSIMVHGLNE